MRDMLKVMVDLDVVTIVKWYEKRDRRQVASRRFMERVETGEFSLFVPDTFLEILRSWEYVELMRRVRSWYTTNAKSIISSEEALKKVAAKTRISEQALIEKFASEAYMKREDVFLVLLGAGSDMDYIVTWNKAHLRDKRDKIEEIGARIGLRVPKIVFPTEI